MRRCERPSHTDNVGAELFRHKEGMFGHRFGYDQVSSLSLLSSIQCRHGSARSMLAVLN